MPQMAPIWWSTLYLIFILNYIVIMSMMYFFLCSSIKSSNNTNKMINQNINWKW